MLAYGDGGPPTDGRTLTTGQSGRIAADDPARAAPVGDGASVGHFAFDWHQVFFSYEVDGLPVSMTLGHVYRRHKIYPRWNASTCTDPATDPQFGFLPGRLEATFEFRNMLGAGGAF